MPKKLFPIYIGALVNRDLEIFEGIKKGCKSNYNISIVNLYNNKSKFSENYFLKKIKKYPLSFIILKLFSENSNLEIYKALRKHVTNVPLLNSLNAVSVCESRKKTFRLIEEKCKKLMVPKTYYNINDAFRAIKNGTKIIVKLDVHNIPFLPRRKRIIGVANTKDEFKKFLELHKEDDLFFQEYLGTFEIIYKVYVIDRWVVTITSHNKLYSSINLSPLELIHIRVPIDKQFKRRILRLGRKFQMPIFGIDYVIRNGIPYIIDVNDFPSFKNVPEATSLISDYIYNLLIARRLVFKTPVKVI